MIQGYVIFL